MVSHRLVATDPGVMAGRVTPLPLYAVLLRTGFGEPTPSPAPLVSSYLTVSPLPAAARRLRGRAARWRSALCSTFRRLTPPGGYPASCPVEFGLSSRCDLGRRDTSGSVGAHRAITWGTRTPCEAQRPAPRSPMRPRDRCRRAAPTRTARRPV